MMALGRPSGVRVNRSERVKPAGGQNGSAAVASVARRGFELEPASRRIGCTSVVRIDTAMLTRHDHREELTKGEAKRG